MSRSEKLRVFCYDVSPNRNRRKIATLLEDQATQVQYSVFEARLSSVSTQKIIGNIEKLLDKQDSLRVYTIGRTGERHCSVHGSAAPIERDVGYWIV